MQALTLLLGLPLGLAVDLARPNVWGMVQVCRHSTRRPLHSFVASAPASCMWVDAPCTALVQTGEYLFPGRVALTGRTVGHATIAHQPPHTHRDRRLQRQFDR